MVSNKTVITLGLAVGTTLLAIAAGIGAIAGHIGYRYGADIGNRKIHEKGYDSGYYDGVKDGIKEGTLFKISDYLDSGLRNIESDDEIPEKISLADQIDISSLFKGRENTLFSRFEEETEDKGSLYYRLKRGESPYRVIKTKLKEPAVVGEHEAKTPKLGELIK